MIPKHLKQALHRLRKIDPKTHDLHERGLMRKHDLGLMDEPVQHRSPSAFDFALAEIERLWGSTHLPS